MFRKNHEDKELRVVAVVLLLMALVIIVKLFVLQIWQYNYYSTLALSTHEIYEKLHATRGNIYFTDARTGENFPAAVNRDYYLVYAVPKDIGHGDLSRVAGELVKILEVEDQAEKDLIKTKIYKENDVYERIARKVDEQKIADLKAANLPGIYYLAEQYRYYPEKNLAANVLGFCALDNSEQLSGRYGLEEFWQKELSGQSGFSLGEKGAGGSWISLAGRTSVQAKNGTDLKLTIDRALENYACERLRAGLEEYQAKSAALVMMDPKTGAILAMCSAPDFDPNNYAKANSIETFNNTAIFSPYEPGSVFKPVAMAAALDLGLVKPETTFTDPCERKIDGYTIHNALDKCYGTISMTGVLENSINTGMIWVEEKLGRDRFKSYVEKFGFGEKTGITLNTETAGDISALDKKSKVSAATASYGQGITATPLQLAAAYTALANGGQLFRPYVVSEVRYPDGHKEKTEPKVVETVISPRTSKLISGMLTSVVEKTYKNSVRLPNYYVAGKTGTAQIAGKGGYVESGTNHTLAGFFPANDPQFVLVIKYEQPARAWAEGTAGPVFRDVAQFALQYFGIPYER